MLRDVILVGECAAVLDDKAIIADLHIGYDSELNISGAMVPTLQVKEMSRRIEDVWRRYNISTLIIDGDLKHTFTRSRGVVWEEIRGLVSHLATLFHEVHIIRGNHDNYLLNVLRALDLENVHWHESYMDIEHGAKGVRVFHGHREVELLEGGVNIMAHEHPAVVGTGDVMTPVRYPAFAWIEDLALLIIPAFSPLMSGTDVFQYNFLSPILRARADEVRAGLRAYAFIDDELHVFP